QVQFVQVVLDSRTWIAFVIALVHVMNTPAYDENACRCYRVVGPGKADKIANAGRVLLDAKAKLVNQLVFEIDLCLVGATICRSTVSPVFIHRVAAIGAAEQSSIGNNEVIALCCGGVVVYEIAGLQGTD